MRLKIGDVVTVCDGQMSNYAYYSEARAVTVFVVFVNGT